MSKSAASEKEKASLEQKFKQKLLEFKGLHDNFSKLKEEDRMKDIFLKERDNVLKEKTGREINMINYLALWIIEASCTGPENSVKGGSWHVFVCLLVFNVFYREPDGPPSRSNWTQRVQLRLEGGSVALPVFITKPIAAFDLPGVGVRTPCPPQYASLSLSCCPF